jgi:hypothetical protein
MDETCGPYEKKCPLSILNLLTPTDNEWANEWRKQCRAYNKQQQNQKIKTSVFGVFFYWSAFRVKILTWKEKPHGMALLQFRQLETKWASRQKERN